MPACAAAGKSPASPTKKTSKMRLIEPAAGTAFRLASPRPGVPAARMAEGPMDNVVKLEKPTKGTNTTRSPQSRPRRRRSRTALGLGGGGFTGGVYEIAALRALDLLAVNKTVNQFDVYVGTSAGSFVASLVANGVTPEEMMRVVNQQVPTPFRDIDRSTLMRPNMLEFAQSMALMPLRMVGLARSLVAQIGQASIVDLVVGLAEGLPSGLH